MLDESVDWGIKGITSNNNIKICLVEGKIADMDSMNLSDGGNSEKDWYSRGVWIWGGDLNFKGWVFDSGKLLSTDLKPMQIQVIFDISCSHYLPEWK